ncbi:MAG: hypothetical protein JW704_00985 [Anaerolineaceae bacterium]|nr:hypothetical protein [Anaerolineaceae bacterium]MBN2676928.1 hypothetical protein [Anaerolineaceae bacterium]
MDPNSGFAKFLRVVAIIFMSLTTLFNLMGGIGSSCIAFFAETYGPDYANVVPYKWLYQLLVVLTTAAAVYGIYAIVQLIKGTKRAWRDTIIALFVVLVLTVIQIIASRELRGKSMPNDARLYITVITLILFLIFRIPGIWKGVNFDRGARKGGGGLAAGTSLILAGLFTSVSPAIFAGTHTFGGYNYASVWQWQFLLVGVFLFLTGAAILLRLFWSPVTKPAVFLAGETKA